MNTVPKGAKPVAQFMDKFEESRLLLRTRHGLRVMRQSVKGSVIEYNRYIAPFIAQRIRSERQARNWTLRDLAERLGWVTGNPKERVWAIENNTRGDGIRLGTLFLLGKAFGIPWRNLLPSDDEVEAAIRDAEEVAGQGT